LSRIGKLIEHNEDLMRSEITNIYIAKQRQITNTGRLLEEYMNNEEKTKFLAELEAAQAKMKGAAGDNPKDETWK